MHFSFRLVFIAVLGVGLVGCATSPPEMEGHAQADGSKSFVISQSHLFKTRTSFMPGFLRGSAEIALLPGRYIAKHQNGLGTYYLGPNPALVERVNSWVWKEPNFLLQHAGGIWIPATGQTKPKLWFYPGSFSPVEGGSRQANGNIAGDIATRNVAQGTVPAMSPAQAGIGAGVAAGLIGAIIESSEKSPVLTNNELVDVELLKSIDNQVSLSKQ
jgi:hypothetical protein